MKFLTLFFPCVCPFCGAVIRDDQKCCKNCVKFTKITAHKQLLYEKYPTASLFRHDDVYRRAILKYKYHCQKQLYIPYSLMLQELIDEAFGDIKFDYYTSVPPHKRKKDNKFDQAGLLAKETARINKCKYVQFMEQVKDSKSQHHLHREERFVNVRGIYRVCDKRRSMLAGKNILLFDDVVTTGATLNECAQALMMQNANMVCCITVNW